MELPVQKLSVHARLPTRGSTHAAGYDLYAAEDATVACRSSCLISTGIAIAVPVSHYGRIAPRSGLAVKHDVSVNAGVIDSDYRGCIKVLLLNHGVADVSVKSGDRIAQLIIEKISTPEVVEVQNLENTLRGQEGFGSTGR
mmetsp:Transcript_419/g.1251  ORF Transcript_419/g.1251 Transcript_419/m.1251 type:complete len:141 (-) Transcript_419:530-952(-)